MMESRSKEAIEAFERNPVIFSPDSSIAFDALKKIIFVLEDCKPEPGRPKVHPCYVIDEIRKILTEVFELNAEENEPQPQVNPVTEEQALPTFTVEHIIKLHEAEIINSYQARLMLGISEREYRRYHDDP